MAQGQRNDLPSVKEFCNSKYFPAFDDMLSNDSPLHHNWEGLVEELGLQKCVVDRIKKDQVKEGLKLWRKQRRKLATLEAVQDALKKIKRLDALMKLNEFIVDSASRKKLPFWKSLKAELTKKVLFSKVKTGLEDDDVSLSSSGSLTQSICSLATSFSEDNDRLDDESKTEQEATHTGNVAHTAPSNSKLEVEMINEINNNNETREVAHPVNKVPSVCSSNDKIRVAMQKQMANSMDHGIESNNNTPVSGVKEVLVLYNYDDQKHQEKVIEFTNWLRKHGYPADVLNHQDGAMTNVTRFVNAKHLLIVVSQGLLSLINNLYANQHNADLYYEDSLKSCIQMVQTELFCNKSRPRVILIAFNGASEFSDLPLTLKNCCRFLYKRERKDLLRRLQGVEKFKLSPLGKPIPIEPIQFGYVK